VNVRRGAASISVSLPPRPTLTVLPRAAAVTHLERAVLVQVLGGGGLCATLPGRSPPCERALAPHALATHSAARAKVAALIATPVPVQAGARASWAFSGRLRPRAQPRYIP